LKKKIVQNNVQQETLIDSRRQDFPSGEDTNKHTVQVGSMLNKRFILEEFIARGGMGIVYKAKDLRKVEARDRNPYIAIKVLTEDFKQHPESWIALQREARKSQQLAHPNIITVYDFDRDGANVFMTMELLEGEPLTALLKRVRGFGLPFKEAFPLIKGMSDALAYAHKQGIVHADFKPGNVFITAENVVKVLDFGIARAIKRPGKREDKTVFDPGSLGALTPAYASFEMLTNELPDSRDDIYALACVTYELLAGAHPFNKMTAVEASLKKLKAKRIKQLNHHQYKALINGLAFQRKDRTSTVEIFLQQLQRRESSLLVKSMILFIVIAALLPSGYYGYQLLNHWQQQRRIEALHDFVQGGELSLAQTQEAVQQLLELTALLGHDPRLEKLRDDLALNFFNLAKILQENQHWREAENALMQAKQLAPSRNIQTLVLTRLDEIKQQQEQLSAIATLETHFESELEQMQAEPDSVKKVLSILKQLAVLAPQHPLVKTGPTRIADALAVTVRKFAQQQQWQKGLQVTDDLLLLLPTSAVLLEARKELDKGYQAKLRKDIKIVADKKARQRSIELRKAKQRVTTLLKSPENTKVWRDDVEKELGRLKTWLPKNDRWLEEMQTSFAKIKTKQQALKWEGAIKAIGAEQTD
jgi:serine/threonine protein kinase